ncbi:hypothetical protein HPP92_004399 [Vanilla planifolia]|nr:hypothetical protein HPP92_004399 [Vanilla planifolia]
MELRRGPWTLEEDSLLVHYIAMHGEGRWNLLARSSGLKRTGKSCRLRWLNYLKPDVKRGNLSPEEQLLILELHSKWGNRWSRIAQHLPGRTDNEIKNYWRTRVQKQARHLRIDTNSTVFSSLLQSCWMPQLLHKMSSASPTTLISPYAVKLQTAPNPFVEPSPFPVHAEAPRPSHDSSSGFGNCVPNAVLVPAYQTQFSNRLDETKLESFFDGEFSAEQQLYDELDLAAAMLSSPAEGGAAFDESGYCDYGGFSDGLWS